MGDMALDSGAQFLAVPEDRLIPARARSSGHQLREAGLQSVWAPACQDRTSGGHAGEDVISLTGAPVSAPSFVGGSFSAGMPRSSAEVRRVFVHHIVEVEVVGQ